MLILLIIGAGLWLGEMPSHLPFFLMMGAVYGGAVFFYAGGLTGGGSAEDCVPYGDFFWADAVCVWWLIRPALEPKLFLSMIRCLRLSGSSKSGSGRMGLAGFLF